MGARQGGTRHLASQKFYVPYILYKHGHTNISPLMFTRLTQSLEKS